MNKTKRIIGVAAFFIANPCFSALGLSQDERLPAKARVTLLFTAMAYDHNLHSRCGDRVRIGVVSYSGDRNSTKVAGETVAGIIALKSKKIKGLGIEVESVEVSTEDQMLKIMEEKKINTIYLSSGLGALLQPVLKYAQSKKVLVVTGEAEYVKKGAAIGVVKRGQKPKILLHPIAAKEQGAKLDARLLRLVEMVR